MIRYTQGNLLEADVEVLVNPVNTQGVMGKGLARQFRQLYPQNMREYAVACNAQKVRTGKMFVTEAGHLAGPRWIVNFPTKQRWQAPSQMSWIVDGLHDFKGFLLGNAVKSVAIPALGVGNGGLPWAGVKWEIKRSLVDIPDIDILVFEPQG